MFDFLVAIDLIYTLQSLTEFIRILSPKSAPFVLFFEGSTQIIAIDIFSKLFNNLLIISSTKDDLPAPPVPVIPKTYEFDFRASSFKS